MTSPCFSHNSQQAAICTVYRKLEKHVSQRRRCLYHLFADDCGSGKYSTDASHKTHTHTHAHDTDTLYQNYILSEERLQESQGGEPPSRGGATIADVDKQGTMKMDGWWVRRPLLLACEDR